MHSSQCQNAYHILSNHKNDGIDSHEFKTSNLYWMFPKDRGKNPKWMVKIMENPIRMGWFGGTIIFGNIHNMYDNTFSTFLGHLPAPPPRLKGHRAPHTDPPLQSRVHRILALGHSKSLHIQRIFTHIWMDLIFIHIWIGFRSCNLWMKPWSPSMFMVTLSLSTWNIEKCWTWLESSTSGNSTNR